jgi:hypothetical protein
MKKSGRMLIVGGIAALVLAVAWWWLTYRAAIGYGCIPAPEAGYCLVGETDTCVLARALCLGTHRLDIEDYSSIGLWFGFLVLCVGLVLDGWKRVDEGEDTGIVPHDFWF